MSATALRDEIKLQLDMQLGAAPPPFEADRLKIAQAFADAIDPHFLHAGESADPATSTTLGMVKTDTDPVGDPVVYLKESVDDLLAGKANVVHSHDFSEITGKPSTLAGYGITDAAPANHNHDSRYLQLTGGTLTGSLVMKQALWLDDYAGGTGNRIRTGYASEGSRFYIAPVHGGVLDFNKELSYDFAAARWVFDETPYVASHAIWHAGNLSKSEFAPASHNHDDLYLKLSGGAISGLLTVSRVGDGVELLRFDTERRWSFFQRGTGPSAALELRPEFAGKSFIIANDAGTPIAEFHGSSTQVDRVDLIPNGGIARVAGNTIWHAGNLDPNSFATAGHTHALSGLSDTSITSPATNHVLLWNGSAWVNSTPSGGGSPVGTSRAINTGTGLTGGGDLSANRTISLDTAYTDGRYLKLTGGTLTGPVTISGNGILPQWTPTDGNVEGSAYPNGITVANVSNDQTYPNGYGTLLSFKHSNSWFAQFLVKNDNTPELWLRTWYIDHWNPWVKLWHNQNDGDGSGLDADLLDGQHASAFASANHNHDSTYLKLTGGSVSGTLYLTSTQVANLINDGALTVGQTTGKNLAISGTSIVARDNGAPAPLYLNAGSGDVYAAGYKVLTERNRSEFAAADHNHDSTYLKLTGGSLVASGDPAIPLSLMRNASSNGDVVLHMSAVNIMSRGSQIRATRLGTGNAHDLSFWTSANASEPTERIRIGGNGGVQIFDNVHALGFYETSSRLLKQNIEDYTGDALALVLGVRIRTFSFKNEPHVRRIGIIAEETDPVFTSPNRDGFSLPDSIAITMRAVQQLAEENERLKKENADLRTQVDAITELVHSLGDRLAAMEARV